MRCTTPLTFLIVFLAGFLCSTGGCAQEVAEPERDEMPRNLKQSGRVYWTADGGVVDGFRANPIVAKRMVEALVIAVTGKATSREAWASLFRPGQRIGIKVSSGGSPLLTTRLAVVASIVEGLKLAGASGRDIVVWDREAHALREAGFTAVALGCRVEGVDGRYLEEPVFFSARLGKLIWGDREFRGARWAGLGDGEAKAMSNKSHFAKLLADVDVIIHVPMMSDSAFHGVHGAIAGMAVDNVDNWRRFGSPPSYGAEDLPLIYAHELIGPKVVLTIMDGIVAQFAGGPWPEPNYSVPHARLYASSDPVALDTIALREIENWRIEAKLPPLESRAKHIAAAGELGLGVGKPYSIDLIQVKP